MTSSSHVVPVAQIVGENARATLKIGDKDLPEGLLNRLPILESSSSLAVPMFIIIR